MRLRFGAFLGLAALLLAGPAFGWQATHPLSGRRIAHVMGTAGADWLNRPERESEEQPEKALDALNLQSGMVVADIGAGTGYYTAILARLVEPNGKVFAYEIEPALAELAKANLADMESVTVYQRSGAENTLPACNLIYVNAGATAPLDIWLDALLPGGRLLFPLTPDGPGGTPGAGGMLLITRVPPDGYSARFLMPVMFINCQGARDEETAKKLAEAFKRGDLRSVRSLRRNTPPDETCWCEGKGWWLSTAEGG